MLIVKSRAFSSRQTEQEMQMALDTKIFPAAFAGAPPPSKNAP
jgi:hypothetical protein